MLAQGIIHKVGKNKKKKPQNEKGEHLVAGGKRQGELRGLMMSEADK
jgi:hypothetical protein